MKGFVREKIWDPVTRLWHWVLAFAVVCNWIFGEFMSFDNVMWHFYLGYFVLTLMAFRLVWGVFGPSPIRFSTFFSTLKTTPQYLKTVLKKQPSGTPGHNPLGTLSVIAFIVVLSAQAITGLFIETEDFFETAPLYEYVSEETVKSLSGWHHRLSKIVLVLVLLHLSAIFFYLFRKRENLIRPMITGWKWVKRD